jgi:uncharacterized protein (TIGR03000 family)
MTANRNANVVNGSRNPNTVNASRNLNAANTSHNFNNVNASHNFNHVNASHNFNNVNGFHHVHNINGTHFHVFVHNGHFHTRNFGFFFFPGLFWSWWSPGWWGFNWWPYYSYPMYYSDLYSWNTPFYSSPVYNQWNDTTPQLPEDYAPQMPPVDSRAAPAEDGSVHMAIRVPADAEIFVDGAATRMTGTVRRFVSPTLEAGKQYTYELTARWTEGGREVVQTRRVNVAAGENLSVDFTQPEAESIAPPKAK